MSFAHSRAHIPASNAFDHLYDTSDTSTAASSPDLVSFAQQHQHLAGRPQWLGTGTGTGSASGSGSGATSPAEVGGPTRHDSVNVNPGLSIGLGGLGVLGGLGGGGGGGGGAGGDTLGMSKERASNHSSTSPRALPDFSLSATASASPMIPSPFSPHRDASRPSSTAPSAGPSKSHLSTTQRPAHRSHPYAYDSDAKASSAASSKPTSTASASAQSTGAAAVPPPQKTGRAGNRRRQKFTRTRTGCLCCRARRIKCDEGRPVCKRCIIAKKDCQYPEGSEPGADGNGSRTTSEVSDSEDGDVETKHKALGVDSNNGNADVANLLGTQADGTDFLPGTGLVDASDFNWDETFVGGYDNPVGATSVEGDATGGGSGPIGSVAANLVGKQVWTSQNGAPMLSTPNFLLPWFPTAEERSLILHYCANAADLMMAIPSGLNPMLAINLPLALDSPRGMNPSADALRVALLGIGAIHQAFLLARSGVSTVQTAAMFQYASNLRDQGKEMVRRAATEGGGAGMDAALGAGTALSTIDIFFGGSGWQDNFKLAKEMVAFRGGPAEMLKASKPTQLADGVSISAARLMLEILAIYETFGCLTTGQEPSLLSDKWENWWFEGSRSTYEEHSVEKQFGMSRVMVHLFSRITRLLSRVAASKRLITETDLPLLDPSSSSNPVLDSSTATPTAHNTLGLLAGFGSGATDPLTIEARKLNADVDAWIESLQLTTLEHERVQVGNRAYAHAMKILLLRMVFMYPREDARVQAAAMEVLKHCSTSTALLGMSIDLTWPAIIAGCSVDGAARQWLLTLLEGFKSQCCFDIETASRIIQEVWRRVDAGEQRADWKPVCDDFGLQVLLC